MSQPSEDAQVMLLSEVCARNGIDPAQVGYVEAHGTGTSLGDPIEATALGNVLGRADGREHDLVVGSIKTNFGHTEAAAGVAGLLKAVLALKHRTIPPTLNYEAPNPLLSDPSLRLRIPTEPMEWPRPDVPLVAGVSGFGFGGTNAHLVVAEAPAEATPAAAAPSPGGEVAFRLLPLSARSEDALRELAGSWSRFLSAPDLPLDDVVHSARHRRTHFEHRLAVSGDGPGPLADRLARFAGGAMPDGLSVGHCPSGRRPQLVFAFAGQGFYEPGMGSELAAAEPVFRDALEQCDRSFRRHVDWSLIEEMWRPEETSRLGDFDIAQPSIFAMQVALAALYRSYGARPTAIVGQSLGEVAAAHVSGALSLDDAVDVCFHRCRLLQSVAGEGKVAVVGLSRADTEAVLADFGDRVAVAGNSSPHTTVVAGDCEPVDALLEALEARDVFCRRVAGVEAAAHSPQMDPLRGPLVEQISGIEPASTSVPFFSTVATRRMRGEQLDAEYWGRNLREPFRFAEVVERLLGGRQDTFLELSPHPMLRDPIRQCMAKVDRTGHALAARRRDIGEVEHLHDTLGQLYALGQAIRWESMEPRRGRPVALPHYPWQRQHFWIDESSTSQHAGSAVDIVEVEGRHPFLGEHMTSPTAPGRHFWQTRIAASSPSYLADHKVAGTVVLPGAAYLEMALGAAADRPGVREDGAALADIEFQQPLRLAASGAPRTLQLVLSERKDGDRFEVFSQSDDSGSAAWTPHAVGRLLPSSEEAPASAADPDFVDTVRGRCPQELTSQEFYRRMAERELFYGPGFQAIDRVWRRDGEALARLRLPALLVNRSSAYSFHPVLLDAALQAAAAALPETAQEDGTTYLPSTVDGFTLSGDPGDAFWCHCRLEPVAAEDAGVARRADITLRHGSGEVLGEIRGLGLRPVRPGGLDLEGQLGKVLYRPVWEEVPLPPTAARDAEAKDLWMVLVGGERGRAVGRRLGPGTVLVETAPVNGSAGAAEILRLDLSSRPEIDGMLETADSLGELTGILDLTGVDLTSVDLAGPELSAPEVSAEDIDAMTRAQCSHVVRLTQALAARGAGDVALVLVTSGAQAVVPGDTLPGLVGAPLWGLSRVLVQEMPDLPCTVLDVDPASDAETLAAELLEELRGWEGEDQLARRAGVRYGRRLNADLPAEGPAPSLDARADYVITGGLGGLGLQVARRLVDLGARRLILCGRTAPPPRGEWAEIDPQNRFAPAVETMLELEAAGVRIETAALDITDGAELRRYFAGRETPIRGVVHAAGVTADRLLVNMDDDVLATPMRPKILGAWLLHSVLAEEELDFFVLFSSAAALLGSFHGQAGYAAGNAFLDALAARRRAKGLPATSIAWGTWGDVGMVADPAFAAAHREQGALPMSPDLGLAVLERLLAPAGGVDPHWMAISADWPTVRRNLSVVPKMLEPLFEASAEEANDRLAGSDDEGSVDDILAADPGERPALVTERLRELIAGVLRLDVRELDPEQSLSSLGIDSILTVELQNRIEGSTGVRVGLPKLMQGPSVIDLGELVLAQLPAGSADETVVAGG
ncbi:MAG: acyltransferase domain-containing protein [Acidobacteriota bacterium]